MWETPSEHILTLGVGRTRGALLLPSNHCWRADSNPETFSGINRTQHRGGNVKKESARTWLSARTINQQTHHNRMKLDVKVHLSGVWMEGAWGCINAGVAHVGISCMSGDCSRQHGKTQNRSASQMFGGRTETFVFHSQTAAVLLTFQLFFTTLYFSIYHLRLERAEITQITFILWRVFQCWRFCDDSCFVFFFVFCFFKKGQK